MVKVNDEDRKFIIANIENGEELLRTGEVNDVLGAISDLIDDKGFYDYDYNDFGRKAQKVYDNVYLYG